MDSESTFVKHTSCPFCGSSDANAVYTDQHSHCFSCGKTVYPKEGDDNIQPRKERKMARDCISPTDMAIQALSARSINKETCEKFGYYTATVNSKLCQVACYYDQARNLIGQKLRFKDKEFSVTGHIGTTLFGGHLWSTGKKIVITEGEIDALSVSQVQGNKWPVVSLPNGAQSAPKVIADNIEYLSNFDEVILMFDMDKPGRDAIEKCAPLLPPGRCKIATLPLKDANECLLNGKTQAIIEAIWQATVYRPDGIVSGDSLFEKCVEEEVLKDSLPYPWECINAKTYGIRQGELIMLTAGSGTGKSTFIRELEYYIGVTKGKKCGIIALEESTKKTGLELMSIEANKRLCITGDSVTRAEKEALYYRTIGNGNYFLYDHFGSLDGDNLLAKLRYMAVALDCHYLFLDHISIAISGLDEADERKAIDKLMTNLRQLVEETGIALFVVSHLKRVDKGQSHEEGGCTSLSQLRGSHAIAQLSDMVIGLERNQQGDSPNTINIRILKNRYSGDTGLTGSLHYDKDTGRLYDSRVSDLAETFDEPNNF